MTSFEEPETAPPPLQLEKEDEFSSSAAEPSSAKL
jgi:hypothetical protein